MGTRAKTLRLGHGLKIDDIDLWELNEAYAVQVIYCRDKLGIDPEKLNVNGGSISMGHPYGMTGARLAGHILIEGRRRRAKYGVARCASAAAWALPACSRSFTEPNNKLQSPGSKTPRRR
jgi:acetyl-CoA acetyltransferase